MYLHYLHYCYYFFVINFLYFSGLLKLDITPPQDNLKYCLTPELIPVNYLQPV